MRGANRRNSLDENIVGVNMKRRMTVEVKHVQTGKVVCLSVLPYCVTEDNRDDEGCQTRFLCIDH